MLELCSEKGHDDHKLQSIALITSFILQTDRQAGRQAGRKTGRQMKTHIDRRTHFTDH